MVVSKSWLVEVTASDFAPASSKEFLDNQATIECGFTLKRVRDMIRTYNLGLLVCLLVLLVKSKPLMYYSKVYCGLNPLNVSVALIQKPVN